MERLEPSIQLVVQLLEPSINGVEPGVNSIEPSINGVEPGVNSIEPSINGIEPSINGVEPGASGRPSVFELADSFLQRCHSHTMPLSG